MNNCKYDKQFIMSQKSTYILYMCMFTAAYSRLCTWRVYSEHHRGGLYPCICAEGTAVETTIFRHHTCQVQTDIQGVCTADPAPVAVVFAHQAIFHLLTHSNNVPGMAMRHLLQNNLVNGAIVLVVTADGQIVVQLRHQLRVGLDHLWGGGLCDVDVFWGLICKYRKVEGTQKMK